MSLLSKLFGGGRKPPEPAREHFRAEMHDAHHVRVTTTEHPHGYGMNQSVGLPGVHGGSYQYNPRTGMYETILRVDGNAHGAAAAIEAAHTMREARPAANGSGQVDWSGRSDYEYMGRYYDGDGSEDVSDQMIGSWRAMRNDGD